MRSRGDLRRVMKDPAGWLASALGVGLIPWAPGTFGSAFALLLWWPMLGQSWFLQLGLLVVTVILSGWSAGRAERLSAVHDPGWIVIDEVVGQWLTLLLLAALLRLLEVPAPAWQQLLFGFYPQDLYWRPVLSLVLFLVAVLPVLFTEMPRKLLILTGLAPFVIFWLLWGGSIWSAVSILLGFALGWAVLKYTSEPLGALGSMILAVVVPLLYWFLLAGTVAGALHAVLPIGIQEVQSKQFGGFMLSIIIGLAGIILSLPLGILLALGRQSDLFFINKVSVGFIEIIRGVPLIVWLFTASLLLNYFLPPGTNFDLMLRVIIMVTLFSSAYIAEVVRGGLAALPKGQYEAADALGLDYWKSMRLIILPQALKISIPGIVNTFIGLFKDTTLVVFIGLLDPIGLSNSIRASTDWNGVYWELFIFIGLMFFIFCFTMGRYSLFLEKKLRREHR